MSPLQRLTVFGAGYLSRTYAACLIGPGFEVPGIETGTVRVAKVSSGLTRNGIAARTGVRDG